MYRVLDLFSGIGGFSLGLERTGGFKTVAFCEIEPFCRRVLAKHWPEVPCYHDVRELTAERLVADGIAVDVICGGFPCQDISVAGKGVGLDGQRSGLWSEIARLSRELRPRFLIVENVSAILGRGLQRVLGDLASLGFDAEWHCIPASAIGAPHRRDRFWLIAYPVYGGWDIPRSDEQEAAYVDASFGTRALADAASKRSGEARRLRRIQFEERSASCGQARTLANSEGSGQSRRIREERPGRAVSDRCGSHVANADCGLLEGQWSGGVQVVFARHAKRQLESRGHGAGQPWSVEPDVGRVAHGVPSRVDRLRALGNAVVPQISELIGNAILASQQSEAA